MELLNRGKGPVSGPKTAPPSTSLPAAFGPTPPAKKVHASIHADTVAAFKAWDKGDSIRSVYLGHTQKHIPGVQGHPDCIDFNCPPHRNRQDLAYAWCFSIIEYFLTAGVPQSHEEFETVVDELANSEAGQAELTQEERTGAESLAWKALMIGWEAAIDGLPATRYVQVQKPAIEAT